MGGPLEGLTHEGDTPGSETERKEPPSNRTRFIVVAAVVLSGFGVHGLRCVSEETRFIVVAAVVTSGFGVLTLRFLETPCTS